MAYSNIYSFQLINCLESPLAAPQKCNELTEQKCSRLLPFRTHYLPLEMIFINFHILQERREALLLSVPRSMRLPERLWGRGWWIQWDLWWARQPGQPLQVWLLWGDLQLDSQCWQDEMAPESGHRGGVCPLHEAGHVAVLQQWSCHHWPAQVSKESNVMRIIL